MRATKHASMAGHTTALRLLTAAITLIAALLPLQGRTIRPAATVDPPDHKPSMPTSGTAPFIFDGNRMYAELTFVRPNGTFHEALAFVDLGSASTIISPALFKELGLDQKSPLRFRIGKLAIAVDSSTVNADAWLPFSIGNRKIEALLPAGVMQRYEVVMDYAGHTLTLAQPGSIKPQGISVPIQVNEKTGLAAVDAMVNGRPYPVTIDNGSSYTWLRKSIVQEWLESHPDWNRGTGAVGFSNMRMADDGIEAGGTLVRIPEIRLGTLHIHDIGALGVGASDKHWDFMDWYSRKNPKPVIGWLGGNVLQGFRITLEYRHHRSYWLAQSPLDRHDLNQVGLTLTKKEGRYYVTAVATRHGKPTVAGVRIGDQLLRVDDLQLKGASFGGIIAAMHGKPGEARTLLLQRRGDTFTVRASITEF